MRKPGRTLWLQLPDHSPQMTQTIRTTATTSTHSVSTQNRGFMKYLIERLGGIQRDHRLTHFCKVGRKGKNKRYASSNNHNMGGHADT